MNNKIKLALKDLDLLREAIGGCGDGHCVVFVRPGMHTNGGCRCWREPMTAQRLIRAHQRFVKQIREAGSE